MAAAVGEGEVVVVVVVVVVMMVMVGLWVFPLAFCPTPQAPRAYYGMPPLLALPLAAPWMLCQRLRFLGGVGGVKVLWLCPSISLLLPVPPSFSGTEMISLHVGPYNLGS